MTQPTTEDDYLVSATVDEFAIDDAAALEDDPDELETDQVVNSSIIQEIQKYCIEEIAKGNTFDVLDIPQNATPEQKSAVFDEMAIHKGVVFHLRNIQSIINNKIKEG